MSPRLHCVSVGHTTLDRYGEALLPGGSAWYGARVFAAMGARSTLCTACGPELTATAPAFAGLELRATLSSATTVFTNVHDAGGRRTQHITTEAESVLPPAAGALGHPDVLFLAPVFGEVDLPAWLDAVPARIVGLGCQGWLKRRAPAGGKRGLTQRDLGRGDRVEPAAWAVSDAVLRRVQVACLSVEDVAGDDVLLDRLIRRVPLVALTLGSRGCLLFQAGVARHVPATQADEVDPTGAGDTFAAGLLFALARGDDPVDAARLGARCAARIVEGQGGENLGRLSAGLVSPTADEDQARGPGGRARQAFERGATARLVPGEREGVRQLAEPAAGLSAPVHRDRGDRGGPAARGLDAAPGRDDR